MVKSLVLDYLLLNVCYCSPTTELLERVMRLLKDCARFYPQVDLNMAENLIVRLEVAVTVQCILDFDLFCAPQCTPLELYHILMEEWVVQHVKRSFMKQNEIYLVPDIRNVISFQSYPFSFSSLCHNASLKDSDLDELIREIRRSFPNFWYQYDVGAFSMSSIIV